MKNLLLSAFIAVCCISFCEAQKIAYGPQPIIVGKTVRYEQTSEWVLSSSKQDKNKGIDILNFQRTALILASGKKCIPTESCLVENVRSTDIKNYSTSSLTVFQKQRNFKILKIITHTDGVLTIPYAIGYWATYTDDKDIPHKVIIIHALNNRGKGLQFLIDCPEEGFASLEEEVTGIIRSLSFL